MNTFKIRLIGMLLFSTVANLAISQPLREQQFDTLSLEQLMNIKITVASIKELTPRESPGIVSYITAEDIRTMGARDLMDVLRFVPGFEFGMDVEGVVGLGVRGNWAHEGKVVLFIDGQMMNDGLYATLQFGQHYPIEFIERIEIIRGPGSSLYGGFAAYAVINIITRTAKEKNETGVQSLASADADGLARKQLTAYYGTRKNSNSFEIKLHAGSSPRSGNEYSDVFGNSYTMRDQSNLSSLHLNTGATIGNLQLRWITDQYTIQSRDEYVEIKDYADNMRFLTHTGEVRYDLRVNEKFRLMPQVSFRLQYPWSTPKEDLDTDREPFRIRSSSYKVKLNSSYDPSPRLNISSGFTWNTDDARQMLSGETFNITGTSQFSYDNYAFFSQMLLAGKWANLIAGVRYNYNEIFGNALLPRVGLTRTFGPIHAKALYSRAFRAPSTQNINLSADIRPEFTDVMEVEAGVKISADAYLTLNAYSMITTDPIIYFFDTADDTDAYTNLSRTGTRGIEAVFQLKKKWGGLDINGSWYHSKDGKDLSVYSVPGENNMHLGLARGKAGILSRFNAGRNMTFSMNYSWLSERYGINRIDNFTQQPEYRRYPSFHLVNLHWEYRFIKVNGLSIRVSALNLLNQDEWFIQPYNSYHAPLPGMGREIQLRIAYQNF